MLSHEDCIRILGVAPDAPLETLRRAYLELARVWHPDRFHSDERLWKLAGERFREINEAYAFLKKHRPAESRQGDATFPPDAGAWGESPVEEAPPEPEPVRVWITSWGPSPARRRSKTRGGYAILNKAAYAVMVTALLALPFVAAFQLAGLLGASTRDITLLASRAMQPGIFTPLPVFDSHRQVRLPARTSTRWTRVEQPSVVPARTFPVAHRIEPAVSAELAAPAPVVAAGPVPERPRPGTGELRLTNHTDLEAVFKLVSDSHTRQAVSLTPNASVTLRSIPVGTYDLYAYLGENLDVALGTFQFLQITSESGTSGSHYDVVLNPRRPPFSPFL